MKIISILIVFQLLISGCLKEKNPQYSNINFIKKNNSKCNIKFDKDECLESFPQIKGPYSIEEKTKAILIMSKYFCLSTKDNFNFEPKQLVMDKFIEENIDLELINSYEVIKKANQISNLMINSCEIDLNNNEKLLKIIKNKIQ